MNKTNKMKNLKAHPLIDERSFRLKNPALNFFCPLCRMERQISYSTGLSSSNYVQIGMISFVLIATTFQQMEAFALIWPCLTWGGFEAAKRFLFKRQVPCPHCGFDATWYKRDVKVARKLVGDFWKEKGIETGKKI